jgi:hypothetical protein
MKVESMIVSTTHRNGPRFLAPEHPVRSRLVRCATAAACLLVPATAHAADPGGSAGAAKSSAVKLESIPGSSAKRVILTAKAAERLGIETGKISEEAIVRTQMVGGLIIPPLEQQPAPRPPGGVFGSVAQSAAAPAQPVASGGKPPAGLFGGFGQPAAQAPRSLPVATAAAPQPGAAPAKALTGEAWVLVTLSQGEWERIAQGSQARVLPLTTRDNGGKQVLAKPSGLPPHEDSKRSMLRLYYVVPDKDHGLTLNNRVRVELQLAGNNQKAKVAPYSAVFYDAKGAAWVYVTKQPLVFERQKIGIERIEGDRAILSDGPPLGTQVVTVGAALLYGTEIFGK